LAADNKADSMAGSTATSKPAHVRFVRRLPGAARRAPAVTAAVAVAGAAGITATAIALSSQTAAHAGASPVTPTRAASSVTPRRAAASSSVAPSYKPRHAAASATPKRAVSTAAPKHAAKSSSAAKPHATLVSTSKPTATTRWFTVQAGDSLSSISGLMYGNDNDWPVLYYANQSAISSPDDISVGQVLRVPVLPATIPAAPAIATAAPAESSSSSSSYSESTPAASTSTASQSDSTVDSSDYSGFQACVIQAESGGDSQVMNSSGHYGLYQFSASTWAAYGGNPADFGDASVAEQNQVFDNAMAAGGESNWAPYDGC
jgi:hypothetical protein